MRNSHKLVGPKHQHCIASIVRSWNIKLYNHGGILHRMLEELAALNEGKSLNPRSPRQVSELLYRNSGSSTRNYGTDKKTLLSIINRETDDKEINRQQRIAQLILDCREVMSSSPTQSCGGKSMSIQSASFSNLALSDNDKGETDDDIARHSNVKESGPTVLHLDQNNNIDASADEDIVSTPPISVDSAMSPYEQLVHKLCRVDETDDLPLATPEGQTSEVDSYWKEPLRSLAKPSARNLVQQLHPHCPMGYDPNATPVSHLSSSNNTTTKKETPLLSFIRTEKRKHFSDTILLVRVGDFYESHGIDAIMLVEHAGLNPMANKARAGCPKGNIQATLDALVGSGFRVAVYEEAEEGETFLEEDDKDTGSSAATKGKKLKERYLSQVVSSANPTYMHNMVLNDNDGSALDDSSASDDSGIGRSYVGVIETPRAGYTLVEISAEERTAVVSERLTAEALSCRLLAYPPADPLFYVPLEGSSRRTDRLPFLPWRQNQQSSVTTSPVSRVRVKTIPPEVAVDEPGLSDLERAKQTITLAFLRLEDDSFTKSFKTVNGTHPKRRERRRVTHEDFVLITPSSGNDSDSKKTNPNPLHLETATQLGLMKDPSIPSLVASLLPESAPSSCRRFLRRWLLVRPPPDVADSMAILVRALKEEDRSLQNAAPLTSKVIPMIRAGQASASVYRNILYTLDSSIQLLDQSGSGDGYTDIIPSLLRILNHDTGIDVIDSATLRESFVVAKELIEEVVDTHDKEDNQDEISFFGDLIPYPFMERNEGTWRGRVKKSALKDAHLNVSGSSKNLAEAVAADFWGFDSVQYESSGTAKSPILQDIFNNIIAIKHKPAWARGNDYYRPRDRNGKVLANRYTTERVENALSGYIDACENAKQEVVKALRRLSSNLVDNEHLSTILQASHLNLITSTAVNHAVCSNRKGWNIGTIVDQYDENGGSAGSFNGLWPYWMSKSDSTRNTFDMNGMFLLTAPNMSG